jgi:hypothetical protein
MSLLDRESRRDGLSGFNSLLLLTLASRPDVDALRAAVAAGTEFGRWLRAPVRRSFPMRRLSRDATRSSTAPRVDLLDAPPRGESSPYPSLLNEALAPKRGENVRFTVFPVPGDGWRVAFLFSHLLADAKAAERMLVQLSSAGDDASWPDPRSLLWGMPLSAVAREARRCARTVAAEVDRGLHSLSDERTGSGGCSGASVVLDERRTGSAVTAGRKSAGYAMEGLWYLACALAADRDTDQRPARHGTRYVVPLPMNLDRRGETRPFGNNLVFLFLGAPVEDAHDPVALSRLFRERMLQRVRDRDDRASQAHMDLCRHLPLALHARLARRSMDGVLGSLFFTNPGPVAARLTRFFGAHIKDVGHFPIPSPRPGICAAVWTFRGRLHLALTWLRGTIADDRAHALLHRWSERVVEVPA